MDLDDTRRLLMVRRDLTGEQFNDGTIAAWQQVFTDRPLPEVRTALIEAAKHHQRLGVFAVVAELPEREHIDEPRVDCAICGGDGMVTVWEQHGALSYSAVVACRCTAGERVAPALANIVTENDKEHDRTTPKRDRTYVRLAGPPEDWWHPSMGSQP